MKNFKYVLVIMIVILSTLLLAACGSNNESSTEVNNENKELSSIETKEPEVLTVGFCATWPPFESRTADGEFEGFDVDMAKEIGKDLGLSVKFVDADYQGLVPALLKGDYDILISGCAKSKEKEEVVTFSDVYYEFASCIVVQDNNTTINGIEDLSGKVVGVQLGSGFEPIADKLDKEYNFKELRRFKLPTDEFLDLSQGRLDAVIVGFPYAVSTIKKTPGFKVVGEGFNPFDIAMVIRKDNQALTDAVNKSLARMKNDGTYDELIKKWLSI